MGFFDFLFGPEAQKAQQIQGATAADAQAAQANTQQGLQQQQQFLQALQQQGGVQNQSDVYNMLAQQAQGQGPNPAQAALQNATGQNVAAQNALMAGQRGGAANPALLARQAAMQGANIQQQAAGQGALMQAQQQANAIGQMGNIAGQQVGNLGQANNAYAQTALGQQGNVLGSINSQNSAAIQNQNMINEANSKRGLGGFINSIGGAIGGLTGLGGGNKSPAPAAAAPSGGDASWGLAPPQYRAHGGMISSNGPQSPIGKALMMESGGVVPGEAEVDGDSLKNDKVPAMLSAGEIVIPRSIAQADDAAQKAAEFVAAIKSRKSAPKKKK